MAEQEWLNRTKQKIEEIRKANPKDRLEYAAACTTCATAIYHSLGRWMHWLSNPAYLNEFDEQTLTEFFEFFKQYTANFLAFDIDATSMRKTRQPRPSTIT